MNLWGAWEWRPCVPGMILDVDWELCDFVVAGWETR